MFSHLKLKDNPKLFPLYSALLTALLFLLALAFEGILGYGNKTILSGDLFSQYTAFIQSFLDVLKGERSFYYSFSVFFGNPSAALYAYYSLSPFNLLYFLPFSVSALTAVIILFKLSLASAMFQLYLAKGLKQTSPSTILFGCAYGLCTFAVSMCVHIMWLDALYTLPVIMLLLLRFVRGSSFLPLIPAYAYLFITNFYMGYICGVFTALCFIALLINAAGTEYCASLKAAAKKILLFGVSVLLAAGICAIVLLPAAYELLGTEQSRSGFSLVSVTLPDVFCNLFMGEMQGMGSPIPLIYCGLPVLILLPAYFSVKNISRKKKMTAAALLVFFLAATQFLPLYRFLHAMEAPNWYAHRYAFCVVFLILTLCSRALPDFSKLPLRRYICYIAALLLLYAILIPIQQICYGSYHTNSHGFFILNTLFLLCYLLLLHFRPKKTAVFISVLLCAELVINAYTCLDRNDFGFHSEAGLEQWEDTEESVIPELRAADTDLYRIRVYNELCFNAASRFGYSGLNSFTTTDNAKLRETLSSLGIGTSFMSIYDQGYTDLTDMIFGVKYGLDLQSGTLSGSPLALPVGFMCSPGILAWSNENDVFTNQENLVSLMTNKKYSFYTPLEIQNENVITKNMEIYPFEDAILFQHVSDLAVNGSVSFSFPDATGKTVLAHFAPTSEAVIRNTAPYIEQGISGYAKNACLSDGTIATAIADEENIPTVTLRFSEGADFDYAVRSMLFCSYDNSSLVDLRKDLGSLPLMTSSVKDGEISATVTATEERPVLFLSIPYDKGWNAYVDDVPVPTYAVVNDSFLGLELTPGTHNIHLVYEAPGADSGKIISAVCLTILLVLCLLESRKNRLPAQVTGDQTAGEAGS